MQLFRSYLKKYILFHNMDSNDINEEIDLEEILDIDPYFFA